MKDKKHLFKAARIIHSNLIQWSQAMDRERFKRLSSHAVLARKLTNLIHKHNLAMMRSWLLAAERIKRQMHPVVHDLSYRAHDLRESCLETRNLPTCPTIFNDLLELDRELGPVQFDPKQMTLSVVTNGVELQGIYLGRFRIELSLSQLAAMHRLTPYLCLAEEPNPAGTDETVTHPHVSNDVLCEGDGTVPIRKALEQGRLCDFFTLITHILHTYNPDSPYIPLDEWDGVPCYDCGRTITSEDRYTCHQCDLDFCDECSSCCYICGDTICLSCGALCHGCDHFVCRSCVALCKACKSHYCTDCLTDGLCETCTEERDTDNETQEEDQESAHTKAEANQTNSSTSDTQTSEVEVQSLGLGQAALLQGQDNQ